MSKNKMDVFSTALKSTLDKTTTEGNNKTEATAEEKAQRIAEGRTQGKKGCKMPRMNMAFTEDNYQMLRMLSAATGKSMTDICNMMIEKYINEHPDIVADARELNEKMNAIL